MNLLLTNFYLFLMAITLAILEIQIEGAHGWAKNLPTWRPHPQNPISQVWTKIMSGKEATGYHLSMFLFVLMIFHLPYVFGLPLTINYELRTLSLYFLFVPLWDFLWFVLNPHHPLSQFKKEHITIHQKWLWRIPIDYPVSVLVSFLVILPIQEFNFWLTNISFFSLQLILVIVFTIYILKIDKWKTN